MHVFAYGSLLAPDPRAPVAPVPLRLQGWQRSWGVAMDNTRDLPGYKHYLDEHGRRPAVFVAFLAVTPAPGRWVNGVLLEVDAAALARLDARERNYRRVSIEAGLPARVTGPVWTYVGLPESRDRQRQGLQSGRLVVSREYHTRVLSAFAELGSDALADFHISTAAPPCPLADLRVVVHGAGAGRTGAPATR